MRVGKNYYRDKNNNYTNNNHKKYRERQRNRSQSNSSHNSSLSKDSKEKKISSPREKTDYQNNKDLRSKRFNRFEKNSKEKEIFKPTNTINISQDSSNIINQEKKVYKTLEKTPPIEESEEINSFILVVKNISRNLTKNHIIEIFSQYGEVKGVEIPYDKDSKLPKGYIFVEYQTKEDAENASLYLGGAQIDGQIIKINQLNTNNANHNSTLPVNNKTVYNNSTIKEGNETANPQIGGTIIKNKGFGVDGKDENLIVNNEKKFLGKKHRKSSSRSKNSRSLSNNNSKRIVRKSNSNNRKRTRSKHRRYRNKESSSSSSSESSSEFTSSSRSSS